MRLLIVLFHLIFAAFAGLAPATANDGGQAPKLLTKLHLMPGRPPQGIWALPGGQILITQDIDGRSKSNWVRFSLLSRKGRAVEKWEVPYGTHGQGLYAMPSGNGLSVFTEARGRDGLAEFDLSRDGKSLSFVREIKPRLPDGSPVQFVAFGVDAGLDEIVVARGGGRKVIQFFRFSDFLRGIATPLGDEIVISEKLLGIDFGALQGVGTSGGVAYMLTGDNKVAHTKYLLRITADGNIRKLVVNQGRGSALFSYEPEGLFVQDGKLIFGVYDYFVSRLYHMPAY